MDAVLALPANAHELTVVTIVEDQFIFNRFILSSELTVLRQ